MFGIAVNGTAHYEYFLKPLNRNLLWKDLQLIVSICVRLNRECYTNTHTLFPNVVNVDDVINI